MDTHTKINIISGIALTIGFASLICFAYLGVIQIGLIDPWVMP